MLNKLTKLTLLLLAAQLLVTCASSKRREDQGPVAKLWHNMNSHYNGYFNARELMDESLVLLEDQHQDNYTQRLDMFPFLEVEDPDAVAENMDIAIEKVAIVVKKHPYSNWVDDSYLLVGQAQLVKQDYESAEKTLRFMTNEFRPRPKRKKSKRRKGKAGEEDEAEEDEFVSRREVEDENPDRARRDRLRARKEAQKERKKLQKEREKENKAKKKERDRQRKARIRARKKGIKLAPVVRDTSASDGLENEPEDLPEAEEDLGPVGMISIFGGPSAESDQDKAFGKKSGSYVVKHRPAYQEGRLWLAWTLIKRDNFDRAQVILEDLRNDRGTFTDVRRRALAVQAFNYLEQERLEEALPFLEEAAAVAESRNERARFYYIAGQLYQELRQPAGAAKSFEQAIAARPDYDLELGARLNLAQNDFLSGSGSATDALKRLDRMAREEKNAAYEGRIYFSAATIALRDGDQATGQLYLRKALDSPSAGPNQRLESYKLLADLAYDDADYLSAKLGYDTTLTVMSRNDLRFAEVAGRRDQLTGVAQNLADITRRDSVLRIGALPEVERAKWAQDLFQSQRAAAMAANTGPSGTTTVAASAPGKNSSFFAYNTSTMRRARRDFERRWGDRSLTDNWRLGSRSNTDNLFADEGDDPLTSAGGRLMATDEEIAALLKGIPVTEAEQAKTRLELSQNYFNLGKEYREQLGNNEKALEAFKMLEDRYPGSENEAEAWYYQHLINKEMGRTGAANEYATKLSRKYTGSRYERLANDPTYAAELMAKNGEATRNYEAALAAFNAGNYTKANTLIASRQSTLADDHPLRARYALLHAMIRGNLEGKEAYIAALRKVVSGYPNTPEQSRAREILRVLGASGARLPGQAGQGTTEGFKESFKELHYLLVVFDNADIDLNEAKTSVSNYNKKYAKLDRLRTTNVYLGTENKLPVLILRRFKNGEAAEKYLEGARQREQEFLNAGKFSYDLFIISQSNYRQMLTQRTTEGYRAWYPEFY